MFQQGQQTVLIHAHCGVEFVFGVPLSDRQSVLLFVCLLKLVSFRRRHRERLALQEIYVVVAPIPLTERRGGLHDFGQRSLAVLNRTHLTGPLGTCSIQIFVR